MQRIKLFFRLTRKVLLAFIVGSFVLVLALRWIDPPGSMVMLAWALGNEQEVKQQWRDLDQISPQLQMSVIASEDQKFAEHVGFDLDSIQKALDENRRRTRGASTISQQVAKNLFLWHGRSYLRKGLEAWFTFQMELLWPKRRILEMYLNIAEFGDGVYGAEAAAQSFFGSSAQQLNSWQSGLLAAVLPNPKRMSAANPSGYVQERARKISTLVRQIGGTSYLRKFSE